MTKTVVVNERGRRIGESHPRAKLTDHDVDLIRELLEGGMSMRQVARKFEISQGTAHDIKSYRRRGQLPARTKRVRS